MKEQVIITKIRINRQGERKHFQIKLPSNTKFIIGLEYGCRLIDNASVLLVQTGAGLAAMQTRTPFKRNQLIGELKLQSCEEANWFYSTDVLANDTNLSYVDFSQSAFPINDFTHGNKRTEELVKIDAESTIIQGWFLDVVGKNQRMDINYEVKIYVWVIPE